MTSHRLVLLVTLLSVAALAMACTPETPGVERDDVTVVPIDEILDGSIAVVDLTPTSGVVQVTTTIDVVCSVVFGTSDEYGGQATDVDMGGGGHRTHAAPMRGLTPDTDYYYRLQGTGPDGTIYVSEPMSFRTPPEQAGVDRGVNLAGQAAGARVTDVSSVFGESPSWAAEHAIDGNPATEWSSAGDGDSAFIEVTLVGPAEVATLGIWTRTMGTSAQILTFQVVTDDDMVLGPFDVPDASGMHVFPLVAPVEARVLRFEVVTSTGGNTGLVEVAAYGE